MTEIICNKPGNIAVLLTGGREVPLCAFGDLETQESIEGVIHSL